MSRIGQLQQYALRWSHLGQAMRGESGDADHLMGRTMKTVVVVPVYNERRTVLSVLGGLRALGDLVSEIVVVEDGSSDGSGEIIAEWAREKDGVTLINHPTNRGYSEALLTGFRYAIDKVHSGQLSPSDAVATVDADGQHDPSELPGFLKVMEEQSLDVVWARRDFSLYPWLKRTGNRMMSIIGSFFAGFPFKDVESGYCVFRIGALEDALRYQTRDSRYSLSLTMAVALARLGYKISNEPIASIKLYRSRTRVVDAIWDTLAAASAWAKVMTARAKVSPSLMLRLGMGIFVFVGLLAVMILIALKSIYLGSDSINNYAHVWYISEHLYEGSLPLHFVNLDGGMALTYPYGFVPWTLAAIIRPVLGDYAVTLTMLLGVILVMVVVYKTRLKSSLWLLALFAAVPFLLDSLLDFQMSFVWSVLFGYLYIWALERRSFAWAYLWLVLAAGNHLVVMGPVLAAYTVYLYWREPSLRKNLLWLCGLALVPLVPLAWYTLKTPAIGENSPGFILFVWLETVFPRGILFFSPFILAKLASLRSSWARWATGWATALCLVALSIGWNFAYSGYSGLVTEAHDDYQQYLESEAFDTTAIYRVVESTGREQGEYYFIQHGAVLANEFYGESYFRRNWTQSSYCCYLSVKKIDYVVLSTDYVRRYKRNEGDILKNLLDQRMATLVYEDPQGRFLVYDVRNACSYVDGLSVRKCF